MYEQFVAKLKAISKMPELKSRIFFTLGMMLVARIGTHVPVSGVDLERLSGMVTGNSLLGFINMFSGGAFQRVSIFALGVMPYINASIVMSLLAVIIPKIDEIQKEGESGRNKITQWTRYLTIVIAIFQSVATLTFLNAYGLVIQPGFLFNLSTIVTITAGTVFLMWLGEQITIKGIGNGVSVIIFLNIISRMPANIVQTIQKMQGSKFLVPVLVIVTVFLLAVIASIVVFQLAQRRIPVHYVGRGFKGRNSSAQNSYLPVKLNSAGVMPVIFASVLMTIPSYLVKAIPSTFPLYSSLNRWFVQTHPVYLMLFAALIIFFSFFYTATMFDPERIADNLKQSGGTIPGVRPGNETVEYLESVIMKITWGGAIFLALVAVMPIAIFNAVGLPVFFGGTSIIIMVGVALDTVQQINAHLVMKEYKGFL